MEEIYHREAIYEFNRPIKDIYEFGEDDSILIVKRLTKQMQKMKQKLKKI